MTDLAANVTNYTIEIVGLDDELRVVQFDGEESISKPFLFQIEIASENSEIDFSNVIGQACVLTIYNREGSEARFIHGIVNGFDQAAIKNRFTLYHLEIVPNLRLLSYRTHNRIFQDLTVQEIIQRVIENANLEADYCRFSLSNSYSPREFCVQYHETDMNFISRLMEEEGIFYYFEHSNDNHTMVIADSSSIHTAIAEPEIHYNESSNLSADQDFILELRYSEKIISSSVKLKDFNFKNPALNLTVTNPTEDAQHFEVYEYPGEYETTERGDALAAVKLESLQAMKKTISGVSNCRSFIPGFLFSLNSYPRTDINQEYLITSVKQSASQPQVLEEEATGTTPQYKNIFICIPGTVNYRAPALAKKPRIEGVQTAIVTGPSGEEIYTDEFGRVKVQFHWDLEGNNDEHSSCWIRVSQLWAGAGWGAMFLPRIGQEVIIDFIEGDPDRPIITGRVYHATNRPPYTLPDDKTKSTIKSESSIGNEGSNEIRFEDKKGEEEVYIHSQKDMTAKSENNMTLSVGASQTVSVGSDQAITVKNNRTKTVNNDENNTIKNNRTTEITSGNEKLTIKAGNQTIEITAGNDELKVKAGNKKDKIKGPYEITVDSDHFKIKCGNSELILNQSGLIELKGNDINIKGNNDVLIKGMNIQSKADVSNNTKGAMVMSEASGMNVVKGGMVQLNPPG